MFVERLIIGSLRLLTTVLPAGRTQPLPVCARPMNRLAGRHALKGFLKDILQSRPYDNSVQPNRFSCTREEQDAQP
jgi:hypothetical protein